MMKDIFIDNCVAKNFSTPIDDNYKELIKWINNFDEDLVESEPERIGEFAHLVVTQKLLVEYSNSSKNCALPNAIPSIIDRLTRQGRLIKKKKTEINEFYRLFVTKRIKKTLLSNIEDHCHIATILLSERKICLTYDVNLTSDLMNFPGFNVLVEKRPENLSYK